MSRREVRIHAEEAESRDVWQVRDELLRRAQTNRVWWDSIDDEQRQAVCLIVMDAVAQLLDNPDAWIPDSVEPKPGNRLDVTISIHLADIDQEVVRRRVEEEQSEAQARTALLRIARDAKKRSGP